jgi:hypothetical protein
MSVIGRLDKQVEDVLINPLKQNSHDAAALKERQREAPAHSDAETDAAPDGQKNSDRPLEKEALPVWLL